MPVTIKSSQVKVKGTDGYIGVDALADSTTASRISAINSAGASALEDIQSEGQSNVSAIEQKGAEVLESIPDDYAQLENDVSSLKSVLNKSTNNEEIIFEKNKYINTTGDTVDVTAISASGAMSCIVLDAVEGDVFTINGTSSTSTSLWCWLDSKGNVLSKEDPKITANNVVIIAPENTSKVVLQKHNSDGITFKGYAINKKVDDNEDAFETIVFGKTFTYESSGNHNQYIVLLAGAKYKITSVNSSFIIFDEYGLQLLTVEPDKNITYTPTEKTRISRIYNNTSNASITFECVNAKWAETPYITFEQFGAVGNGETDDTQAISDAIDYANEHICHIVLGYKAKYKITSDLPKLYAGISIVGLLESSGLDYASSATFLDHRTTGHYLFEQIDQPEEGSRPGKEGGVFANFFVQNKIENSASVDNSCFYFKYKGWPGLVKNIYIYNYKTAIRTEADDYTFDNIAIRNCGNRTNYAVEIRGSANYQRFNNCSVEGCYHNIRILGAIHNIIFSEMHLEMTAGSTNNIIDNQPPISITSNGSRYESLFVNCFFTCLDKLHYAQKTSLQSIPYFVESGGTIPTLFSNCVFTCGNISEALGTHYSRLLLAKGTHLRFENNKIDGLSRRDVAVDLDTGSCFRGNMIMYFNDPDTDTDPFVSQNIVVPDSLANVGNIFKYPVSEQTGIVYQGYNPA